MDYWAIRCEQCNTRLNKRVDKIVSITCPICGSIQTTKNGIGISVIGTKFQRYNCGACGNIFQLELGDKMAAAKKGRKKTPSANVNVVVGVGDTAEAEIRALRRERLNARASRASAWEKFALTISSVERERALQKHIEKRRGLHDG
jgi:transposase-like protein